MAGAAGAMTIAPGVAAEGSPAQVPALAPAEAVAAPQAVRQPLEALTAAEADLLDAVVARLIPTDANGPGATEANAVRYIDRALSGWLAGSREAYREGLAALERHARASRGSAFADLSPDDQDAVLIGIEEGPATSAFFALVRAHTLQGVFGDPFYGGNANFTGWDLIGYPGVRTIVAPADQRMGARVVPNHRSAYDGDMFTKAQASSRIEHGETHGD
jgi:gluconate 2-dehydrogenase gamma chain